METMPDPEAAAGQDRWTRRRGFLIRYFGLSCLAFLAYPIVGLFEDDHLLFLLLALFAAGYARVIWRNTPHLHTNRAPLTIVATLICGSLLVPALEFDWFTGMSFFACVMLLVNFPLQWWRAIVIGLTVTVLGVAAVVLRAGAESLLILALLVLIMGAMQVAVYKHLDTSVKLHQARIELTQLAVAEERLRIARDLHDILGQRLSAIALKAEVATRLAEAEPRRAILEMTEAAAMARDGLAEARAAVTGYRQVTLAAEAQAAEALLRNSGLEVTVHGTDLDLPRPADECAGWVVREAATNAVRHARARRCGIEVAHVGDSVVVEVRDDGLGAKLADAPPYGTGLIGLTERVAIVDGELTVGVRDGWFVVRACLPAQLASERGDAARDRAANR